MSRHCPKDTQTVGQQAHEKILNIAKPRNANQKHSEITPHTCLIKKAQETAVGKDVKQREPLHIIGGNVNWCSHCGKRYGDSLTN